MDAPRLDEVRNVHDRSRSMPRLLVVTYLYPPAGSVGVHRLLRFLKWLPRLGWEPIVLTPRNARPAILQPALVDAVSGVEVHRSYSFELLNAGQSIELLGEPRAPSTGWRVGRKLVAIGWKSVAVPDVKLGWVPFAASAGARLMRTHDIRAIYVSGKPFSSYLVADRLSRRFDVPWVMDVRDLWALNRRTPDVTAWHTWANARLEARCVRSASAVIANTPGNRQEFIEAYPECRPEKFVTITNGYDRDEFQSLAHVKPEKFTIGYTGTFYFDRESKPDGNIFESHSPVFLLEALKRVLAEREEMRGCCQVVIAGPRCGPVRDMASRLGLSDVVRVMGWVGHRESLELQRTSHLLFLVLARGEESKSWVPAKLYQYLGSGTPILALVPDGDAARIVRETRAGDVVPPDDVEQIAAALRRAYDRYRRGIPSPSADDAAIRQYEAAALTRRLVEVLHRVTGRDQAVHDGQR